MSIARLKKLTMLYKAAQWSVNLTMHPEGPKDMDSPQDQVQYRSQLPLLVKEGNRICNFEYMHMNASGIEINIDRSEQETETSMMNNIRDPELRFHFEPYEQHGQWMQTKFCLPSSASLLGSQVPSRPSLWPKICLKM